MSLFPSIDWQSALIPSISLVEIFIRGTFIYLFLFFILRILRREAGAVGISDLLVVVLIADAAQNAMASEYKSITEGAVLIATIAGWDYFLDWLSYHFPKFRRIIVPKPLPLIKNGTLLRRNLRQEAISKEELMAQLRKQGIEEIQKVKKCYLEGDGSFSIITNFKNENKNNENSEKKIF